MENSGESNPNTVLLLGKRYPVIECSSSAHVMTDNQVPTAVNGDDKDALLRQMSTTNDPEEDIYTASVADHSATPHGQPTAEDNQSFSDTTVPGDEAIAQKSAENTLKKGEIVVASTTGDSQNDAVESSAEQAETSLENLDDAVNLALSLQDGSGDQTFEYEAPASESSGVISNTVEDALRLETEEATASLHDNEQPLQLEPPDTSNDYDSGQIAQDQPPDEEVPVEYLPPDFENEPVDALVSLSGKLNILEYAQSEWKGTTYTAKCLRSGYQKLIQDTSCTFMRQVRGDNYCALRATAFQILSQNIKILRSNPHWMDHIQNLPEGLIRDYNFNWLSEWSFADRLPSTKENRTNVMQSCLSFFVEQKRLSEAIANDADRQKHFFALFNSGSSAEIKIFEAMKLLMLETAIKLHTANAAGDEVPVFAWLLFARDNSEDPRSFMINHLNLAGKTGGLEQVEMCLLGHALEVTIQVYRPSKVEQEDFITHYPDHKMNEWEKICLIAEDDRHYNIVTR